ncbi:hypothetical protein [Actinomadura sp. WMMB 499]|uniref:hypothetical protein n=1 Tax=Actinomadura sp. WMMB 499 TaxID=1219491 RepID=UPI001247A0C6|nr:hypothetical protein [Actinomadura sp. WMMB 499]QFG23847.1 hypothetical protein F7P10_24740 [Actinomadura sp. WMMB 499]
MVRVARAVLFGLFPFEIVLLVLLVSGVAVPRPVVVAGEAVVLAALALEGTVAFRLYRAARRDAGRAEAVRRAYRTIVPVQVRRVMAFDKDGMVSLAMLVARRRHGVPEGAVGVPYAGAQTATMLAFLAAMVVELVVVEVLLGALGVPAGIRLAVLMIDLYSVVIVLAVIAACVTRPHVVTDEEVRVRYGAFFDLRIPREKIASVRTVRRYDESGPVRVDGERLAVAVGAQTNVLVELTEPVVAVRPLGKRARVRSVRFYADDPSLVASRTRRDGPAAQGAPR